MTQRCRWITATILALGATLAQAATDRGPIVPVKPATSEIGIAIAIVAMLAGTAWFVWRDRRRASQAAD